MKRVSKKILCYIMVAIMLIGCTSSMAGCGNTAATLSRAEWITKLAESFGMDNYTEDAPVFSDVSESDDYYAYVRSCADWGVLSNAESSEFDPDSAASTSFAVETALLAAGVDLSETTVEECALELGMISDTGYMSTRKSVTAEEADSIIEVAKSLYLNAPVQEVVDVTVNEDLIDLTGEVEEIMTDDGETFVLSSNVGSGLSVGDVFVAPGDSLNPSGIARKVTAVTESEDGTLVIETVQPAIEDVLVEGEFTTVAVPKAEDVILAPGVTFTSNSASPMNAVGDFKSSSLVYNNKKNNVINVDDQGANFSFNISFSDGDLSFGGGIGYDNPNGTNFKTDETITFTDFSPLLRTNFDVANDKLGEGGFVNQKDIDAYRNKEIDKKELKNRLKKTAKSEICNSFKDIELKKSYEITGTVSVKNLYVTPHVELKKNWLGIPVGIKEYSVDINADVTSSLELKGSYNLEDIVFASVPIVCGATGFVVTLDLVLKANFDGTLSVEAVCNHHSKMEYTDGKTKRTNSHTSSISGSAEVELKVGPGLVADLKFLGLSLVDAEVALYGVADAEAKLEYLTNFTEESDKLIVNREIVFSNEVTLCFPVIELEVGSDDSLAGMLGLSMTATLVSKESTPWKVVLVDGEYELWKKVDTLPLEPDEEATDGDEDSTDSSEVQFGDIIDLNTYYLDIELGKSYNLSVVMIPEGYSLSDLVWSSEDTEIATVSGGTVIAKGSGSTIIKVSTSDGKYTARCTIHVAQETFEFEGLKNL